LIPATSCGILAKPATSWVGSDNTTALLIQFTRAGSNLQGTLDATQLQQADAETTDTQHLGFTGVIDGSRVTLTFNEGLGFTNTISGTITRSRLTLNFPDTRTGQLVSIALHPGGTEEYQTGVDALQAHASANAQQAAQASASAAAEAELTGASDAVENAVENDVNTLDDKLTKGPDFSVFDADLASAKKALGAAKTYAAKAKAEGRGSDDGCYDASNAAYEASNVQYYVDSIDYDAQNAQSTIEEASQLTSKLTKDYQTLQRVLHDQDQPGDTANDEVVSSLQDKATKALASWRAQVADYQTKVKKLVAQANAAAESAQQAVC
jgi:hypothetical protein